MGREKEKSTVKEDSTGGSGCPSSVETCPVGVIDPVDVLILPVRYNTAVEREEIKSPTKRNSKRFPGSCAQSYFHPFSQLQL